jgi:lipoprotein-releasing system permease protein
MGVFIIGLIVFIAVLNITATLILLVVERRGDIAILSAMGASSSSIMTVFVIEGAVLGLIGAVLGVALGLAGSALGNRFNIVSLPADVYSISNIPFHPQASDIVFAALLAFGLSLVATLYPARAAARMRPADILREV